MIIRRKTREMHRRELAAVRQELGAVSDADQCAFWRANQERAAELRRRAQRGGGRHEARMGLVTSRPGVGGAAADTCPYCGESGGGHTGQCPVVS